MNKKIIKQIRKTEEYKQWKSIMQAAEKFPLEAHYEEVFQAHKSRKSRDLYGGRWNAKKISEASGYDSNVRSRAVELMSNAKRLSFDISAVNESMIDFIISEGFFKSGTQTDRKASAKNVIKKGSRIEQDFDSFIEIIGDIVNDIDQAGWSMRRMLDAITINSRPEASI